MYIAKSVSDFKKKKFMELYLLAMQFMSIHKSLFILMYCNCTESCFPYLIMALISLSENLTVGTSCLYDIQCTGTEFGSVCILGQCKCQSGYIRNATNCYPGK